MKKLRILCFALYCILCPPSARGASGAFDFDRWNILLNRIQDRAVAEKIDDRVINATIQDAAFIPKIVWRDQNQSEFKLTMEEYLAKTVNDKRIADGMKMAKKYPTLLRRVERKYKIPGEIILAFWGLESSYGEFKARYQLSDAFITLIYEGRREKFFTDQLLALMKIASRNKLDIDGIRGSWAGAMGHFQFIPTTLLQYGVDGNGDGKIDIISNIGDAMFSAGNYLNKLGWNPHEKIMRRVRLPEGFDFSLCGGDARKTLSEWRTLGVTGAPAGNMVAGMICERNEKAGSQSLEPGPALVGYLAYPNFYRVKKWNNSNWYAIAVGRLSEKLKSGN